MPTETISHQGRKRTRWYPEASIRVKDKRGLGVVFAYTNRAGRLAAVAYAGQSSKASWHYGFKDEARRTEAVRNFFAALQQHKALVAGRRAEANAGHTLKVGDIITNSWGYDQTNVDWYRVVKVSRNFVWLEEIASDLLTDDVPGPMAGKTMVALDDDGKTKGTGKITKRKAAGENVTMRHGIGSKWDGRALYTSWYA